ncbi:MAG: hypothetical protein M1832_003117 [Thelocarpon impressellum]|nr:MAG: hypothetical protein M1832_003117 [Thelocarpon impressellum]
MQMDQVFNDTATHLAPNQRPHGVTASTTEPHPVVTLHGQALPSPSPYENAENGPGSRELAGAGNHQDEDINDDYAMSLDFEDDEEGSGEGDRVPDGEHDVPVTATNGLITSFAAAAPPHSEADLHDLSGPLPVVADAGQYPAYGNDEATTYPHNKPDARSLSALLSEAANAATLAAGTAKAQDEAVDVDAGGKGTSDVASGGVDIQALLDNLSPAISTAPTAGSLTTATTASPGTQYELPQSGGAQSPTASLPAHSTLPPRPPPQEKPATHPGYSTQDDIRSYHPHTKAPTGKASHAATPTQPVSVRSSGPGLPSPVVAAGAPGTSSKPASGLPPPPVATFQQSAGPLAAAQQSPTAPSSIRKETKAERKLSHSVTSADEDDDREPLGKDAKKAYEDFLHEERVYVSEGQWDRFPAKSRLFIGNLPTEKVSKRDLFQIFCKYGKLAQVSIKQAYGFIQFLEAAACQRALQAEQGQSIRGRKMNLEISKPQKNTRNAAAESGGEAALPLAPGGDAMAATGQIVELGVGTRARTPPAKEVDEDAALPLPRRAARDIPEAQIIVIDELDRNFVTYVEKTFVDRGIQTDVLFLTPRLPLGAVIRRQILEGVQAVARLSRESQMSVKIPLQVFDRRGGVDNVRFDEYEGLDPPIAAELVVRAKQTHGAPSQAQYNAPAPAYQAPPYGQSYAPPAAQPAPPANAPAAAASASAPNIANLITSLDGATLQKLIGALQQQTPQPQQQAAQQTVPTDLASLLAGGSATHQAPPHQQQQHFQQANPYAALAASPAFAGNPGLASLLAGAGSRQQQPPQQPQQRREPPEPVAQVQGIMEQLAKWKQ